MARSDAQRHSHREPAVRGMRVRKQMSRRVPAAVRARRRGEADLIAVAPGLGRPIWLYGNDRSARQQPQTSQRVRDTEFRALNGATHMLGARLATTWRKSP
jgi:hypothetical protein